MSRGTLSTLLVGIRGGGDPPHDQQIYPGREGGERKRRERGGENKISVFVYIVLFRNVTLKFIMICISTWCFRADRRCFLVSLRDCTRNYQLLYVEPSPPSPPSPSLPLSSLPLTYAHSRTHTLIL
jgi:hypothetical protein